MTAGPPLTRMAWRNLWRQRRRTILTLSSIAFGFLLAVLFTAMQDEGFADMIDRAARMGSGHVTVQHRDYLDTPKLTLTVDAVGGLAAALARDPGVIRVLPRITGQATVSTARDSFGAFFVAFDPALEDADSLGFVGDLDAGRGFEDAMDKGIILGKTLANNLSAELGDRVVYRMVDRSGEVTGGLGRLIGTVSTGAASADAGLMLLPIGRLRKTLGYGPDESTLLAVFLDDPRAADDATEELAGVLRGHAGGDEAVALTWQEVRPELSGFIAMKVGGARFMELVIMLLVAAGIFNTLFVSVMERMREFGIMLAIGYSPSQLFRLVMWESALLASVGLVVGAALTAAPYFYLASTGLDVSGMVGGGAEVAGVALLPVMKVGIFPENLAVITVAVVLATLTAGLYPAWRASRVAPVDAIKLV